MLTAIRSFGRAAGRASPNRRCEGPLGIVQNLVRLASGLRIRVVDGGTSTPVQEESRRPPPADDSTADARGAVDVDRHDVLYSPLDRAANPEFRMSRQFPTVADSESSVEAAAHSP